MGCFSVCVCVRLNRSQAWTKMDSNLDSPDTGLLFQQVWRSQEEDRRGQPLAYFVQLSLSERGRKIPNDQCSGALYGNLVKRYWKPYARASQRSAWQRRKEKHTPLTSVLLWSIIAILTTVCTAGGGDDIDGQQVIKWHGIKSAVSNLQRALHRGQVPKFDIFYNCLSWLVLNLTLLMTYGVK